MDYRIQFLRDVNGQPVGCLAIKTGPDFSAPFVAREKNNQLVIAYQVSALNPVDRFDRAFARQIALGRAVESPFIIKAKASTMHEISTAVMKHLVSNKSTPARTRRAAKLWLKDNDR